MKPLISALIVLVCLGMMAQAGTVVTFDDFTGAGLVPNGYDGINWGGNWAYFDLAQFPYTAHSGAERVFTPNSGQGEYRFTFINPQVFQGAWFAGVFSTTVQFFLYDAGLLVHTTPVFSSMWQTPTFVSSGYSGLIDQVGVFANANGFYVMDDVTYGVQGAVPEPGTIALLGTGLALVAGMAIRRRRDNS